MSVLVHHRVHVVAAAQHLCSDILRKFILSKGHQRCLHDAGHGRRKVEIPGGVHGAVSGEDDWAVAFLCRLQDLLPDMLRPDTDEQAGSRTDHRLLRCRIIPDNHDPVPDHVPGEILPPGHRDDGDLSVYVDLLIVVDDGPVDGPCVVGHRSPCHDVHRGRCVPEADDRNIALGHQANQRSVSACDAAVGLSRLLHLLHAVENRRVLRDTRRRIEGNLQEPDSGILQKLRFPEVKPLQQVPGLRIYRPQPAGHRPVSLGTLVESIGNGCRHRVCVRVPVPGDIDPLALFWHIIILDYLTKF